MINIGDNLGYNGTKPNFTRDSFSTVSTMAAISDTNIDDGHISYCIDTNKHYKFNRNNIIDSITGKWRDVFSNLTGLSEDIGINQKLFSNSIQLLSDNIALKQNKLLTGSGIQISDQNVISATVSSYTYAGTVSTVSLLPSSSTIGYFYCVTNDTVANTNYAWNGTNWQSIGNSLYQLATESKNGLMSFKDKQKITLLLSVDNSGFFITDSNGYNIMECGPYGFNVALLSENIKTLIKQIDGLYLSIGEIEGTVYSGSKGKQNADNITSILASINKILLTISSIKSLLLSTSNDCFNITDLNGNIGFKYDVNGLDVSLLSSHFILLIKDIEGIGLLLGETNTTAYSGDKGKTNADNIALINGTLTKLDAILTNIKKLTLSLAEESGLFAADENGNVILKYDSSGFDVALLSEKLKQRIKEISGIGGTMEGMSYTLEEGVFFVDENGYIISSITSQGVAGFNDGLSSTLVSDVEYTV